MFQVLVGSQYEIYKPSVFSLMAARKWHETFPSFIRCNTIENLLILLLTRQPLVLQHHLKTSSTCQTLMIACIQQSTDLDFHCAAVFFSNNRFLKRVIEVTDWYLCLETEILLKERCGEGTLYSRIFMTSLTLSVLTNLIWRLALIIFWSFDF